VAHLQAAAPWRAVLVFGDAGGGEGFQANTDGPAFAAATRALETAYGRPVVTPRPGRLHTAGGPRFTRRRPTPR